MNTLSAADLRIGNYIEISFLQDNGEFKYEMIQVIANTIKDAERYGDEWDARPIELTAEWLLKAGFKTHDHHDYFINISDISDFNSWFSVFRGDGFYYISEFDIKLKYLHQLQNLYKELTGNELMFKEK